ncbi:MAG: hypothetical protein PVH64_09260 [Bacillota bacterium]|jgi:putative phosphonate transport system ATP-binding protein
MNYCQQNRILRVKNLTKIYGPGCPQCIELTGPAFNSNQCPVCGSIVACAAI